MNLRTKADFFHRKDSAVILRKLFDRRELWEARQDRKLGYRNGDWFTLGSSLYLDLKSKENFLEYTARTVYWRQILNLHFSDDLWELKFVIENEFFPNHDVRFLADAFPKMPLSYPGFHIFPSHETFEAMFGRSHCDHQWQALPFFPDWSLDLSKAEHFSFTLPLKLPYLGGRLHTETRVLEYVENTMYLHSGQFEHAIGEMSYPILPGDWRITIQGHGFKIENQVYLYW